MEYSPKFSLTTVYTGHLVLTYAADLWRAGPAAMVFVRGASNSGSVGMRDTLVSSRADCSRRFIPVVVEISCT